MLTARRDASNLDCGNSSQEADDSSGIRVLEGGQMATCDRNALTERTARRVVTMVPAFIVVGLGVDSMQALVISQVVLSFVLPVPMLALVYFTSRRDVMGEFASTRTTRRAAIGATVVIGALNVVLLVQSIGAMVPHPSGN
nr:divalent metal cation transporter [Burkholderia anthina]